MVGRIEQFFNVRIVRLNRVSLLSSKKNRESSTLRPRINIEETILIISHDDTTVKLIGEMFALQEDAFIFNEFLEPASNDSESEDLWTEDAAEAIDSASKCDLEQILMNNSDWSKSKNGTNVDELSEKCSLSRRILISSKFERLSDIPLRLHQKVFYIILDPRQAVVGKDYLISLAFCDVL